MVPPEDRWPLAGEPLVERPVPWPGERHPGSGRRVARASSPVRGSLGGGGLGRAGSLGDDGLGRVGLPGGEGLGRDGPLVGDGPGRTGESTPGPDDEPASGWSSRLPGPGAFDPGRRGVRALAAVAVAVVLGAGFWAWRSRPQAEPVRAEPSAAAGFDAASEAGAPAAAPTPGGELVVAVAGKVRRPGLVRVPAGARVGDAVQAAGGALPGVDVALLNPARKVADGELILVGVTAPPGQPGAAPAAPGQPAGGGPAAPAGLVNLNTATLAQLDTLPGVGPVLAQRILDHRDRAGGFRSVGDLRQVEGIGDSRYEQLKELVTV
ncbi:competence protein ComEA [Micromonospora carbonacea]|uniref:Competence protein ComEA n=1 Tax=Micromonospora carbonacea TaxID=47853 RepID=A0A1C4XN63_9ACTN|nr:competence protein ComEA [Micromonospora carbonacea]